LGALISASEQDYFVSVNPEVHSIAGPDIKPQLVNSISDRLTVAVVSELLDSPDPCVNPASNITIELSDDPLADRTLTPGIAIVLRFSDDQFRRRLSRMRDLNITITS
jgi:hypothetical protein